MPDSVSLPGRPPAPARWPDQLLVLAWPDALLDQVGYSPRSRYVETYWLGILGPSATWLLRRLDAGLEVAPDGYSADLGELASCLGLRRGGGRRVSIERALDRCVAFDLAQRLPADRLAVRRHLPPLPRRHLSRLPRILQAAHEAEACCTASPGPESSGPAALGSGPAAPDPTRRAFQLATSLVRLGASAATVEAELARWQVHPALIPHATAAAFARPGAAPVPAGRSVALGPSDANPSDAKK
ncbi:hypothetical protein [Aciditerrimonas ferrireducens]|uniref:hypothetical protein n=1 Tax=Aciditerrimonas ferrireducens TaxID=667306 RepID=UPI002006CAC2|nr:hypothetical protein [Aciditerrimonas ferrireducens]MCK4177409.1 hypothetical protein [Aciditerrimonas ferrireducens]